MRPRRRVRGTGPGAEETLSFTSPAAGIRLIMRRGPSVHVVNRWRIGRRQAWNRSLPSLTPKRGDLSTLRPHYLFYPTTGTAVTHRYERNPPDMRRLAQVARGRVSRRRFLQTTAVAGALIA